MAIAALIVKALVVLMAERFASLEEMMSWEIDPLEKIFPATIHNADEARIDDPR